MSKATHGVHRCPSCDELADAEYGEGGKVTCLKCGHVSQRKVPASRKRVSYGLNEIGGSLVQRDVVARRSISDVPLKPKTVLPEPEPSVEDGEREVGYHRHEEIVSDDGEKKVVRRRKRKRKFRIRRFVFVALWALSVFLILFLVRRQMDASRVKTTEGGERGAPSSMDRKIEEQRRAEADGYVRKSMPECQRVLGDYFAAPDAAARAQHVFRGSVITPMMASYYRRNTPFRPGGSWLPVDTNLVLHKKLRAIESVWKSQNEEGEQETREIVFVREEGTWKLDWEFFVRHSTAPWHMFLAEGGPTEGTFRVYMRLREQTFTDDGGEVLNLRFYPPLDQQLVRNRASSPTVLVPVNSESGRRLLQVVALKDKEPLAGERGLHHNDPDRLHRVRVVLEWREGTEGERYLHLKKVLAGNWLAEGFEEDFSSDPIDQEAPTGPAKQ